MVLCITPLVFFNPKGGLPMYGNGMELHDNNGKLLAYIKLTPLVDGSEVMSHRGFYKALCDIQEKSAEDPEASLDNLFEIFEIELEKAIKAVETAKKWPKVKNKKEANKKLDEMGLDMRIL